MRDDPIFHWAPVFSRSVGQTRAAMGGTLLHQCRSSRQKRFKVPILSSKPPSFLASELQPLRGGSRRRDQIGQELREFYRANMTEKLPPQLLALVKKLEFPDD